ncbi:MAG: hypothetical protein K2W92_02015 [Alphaproteobacteria bacterium]|nr:hypothetical protein [Alphaproteobacteria bacterium]
MDEVSNTYLDLTHDMFEKFCSVYLTQCINAYNYLPEKSNNKQVLRFFDLSTAQQAILAAPYACILYIHYINRFHSELSNIEKFKLLVNTLISEIDLLDCPSCLIAAHCFRTGVNTPKKIKTLKDNFLKKSSKGHIIIKNSLNAARDIINYRTIAYIEYSSKNNTNISMRPLEAWFLTEDNGLKILSEFIIYDATYEGHVQTVFPDELLRDEIFAHNYAYFISKSLTRSAFKNVQENINLQHSSSKKITSCKKFIYKLEEMFIN